MVKFTFEYFESIGSFYGDLLKDKADIETVDDFLNETNFGRDFGPLLAKLNAPDKRKLKRELKDESAPIKEERLVKWCM
nr:hypothetical protein [Candidatus Sigynarchaeota archaeon]